MRPTNTALLVNLETQGRNEKRGNAPGTADQPFRAHKALAQLLFSKEL